MELTALGMFMLVSLLISVFYNILTLTANFIMFKKIGKNKWLGLVPVVNDFILFDYFWSTKAFIVYIITYVLFWVSSISSGTLAGCIYLITVIVVFVIDIILMDKIRKRFNKGFGYAIGLLALYPIFLIILAKTGKIEENKEKASD